MRGKPTDTVWSAEASAIEIEVTPPGPPDRPPWWTIRWDGTRANIRTAPGLQGDGPEDWGITCTRTEHTDAWLAEGGTGYVIEQILDGFASSGASVRIVAVHGEGEARLQMLETLQSFVDEHPECSAELRRFVETHRQD